MARTTSKSHQSVGSRETLLAAACDEFALNGFDGASVEAIAVRAGVTKAMICYYFQSKEGLYREIVRAGFSAISERTQAIVSSRAGADEKMAAFVAAVCSETDARAYLAPIMTREMADGARRLDQDTLRLMSRVFVNLSQVLEQGVREGIFREVNPFFAFQSVISPIVFFRTSQPLRAAMSRHRVVEGAEALDTDLFLAHHTSNVLQALTVETVAARRARYPRRQKSKKD